MLFFASLPKGSYAGPQSHPLYGGSGEKYPRRLRGSFRTVMTKTRSARLIHSMRGCGRCSSAPCLGVPSSLGSDSLAQTTCALAAAPFAADPVQVDAEKLLTGILLSCWRSKCAVSAAARSDVHYYEIALSTCAMALSMVSGGRVCSSAAR